MATQTKVVTFTQPSATGSHSITGVGFKGKFLLLFGNEKTADGAAANNSTILGVATSSSDRRTVMKTMSNGVSNTAWDDHMSTVAYQWSTSAGAAGYAEDFVSFDNDGFTLNCTVTDSGSRIVSCMVIGGSDITNVLTGATAMISTTGNQSITGVGFKPDLLMMFMSRVDTSDNLMNASSTFKDNTISFGMATAYNQAVLASRDVNNATTNEYKAQLASRVWYGLNSTGNGLFSEASWVSMDADGFTVNFGTAAGAAYFFYWVAIKGGQYQIGTFNQPAANGTQLVFTNFKPTGLFLSSMNAANSGSISANARRSFGVTDGTNRSHIWDGGQDALTNANTSQDLDRTKVIKMMTEGGATPTTQAAADITSFNSNNFVINWSTTDATAREVVFLAVGSNVVPALSVMGSPRNQPEGRMDLVIY